MIDVPREDIVVMLESGYVYLAMKKFKEAREIFEGVAILTPKHDIPQVALANVHFAQGKYLESIRVLKQAIKDRPDSAFAHAYLGESYLFYGKREEAYATLGKASDLEPTGKSGGFARAVIELMNQGYDPVELRKAAKKAAADAKSKAKGKA